MCSTCSLSRPPQSPLRTCGRLSEGRTYKLPLIPCHGVSRFGTVSEKSNWQALAGLS